MTPVVFVHGWGFHPGVWAPVAERLAGVTPHYVDLGFISGFQGQTITQVPEDAVLVGHSLGVMWLLRHLPARPRGVISISGFDCFFRYTDVRDVKAMQRNLKRNPLAQMQGFWQACGVPDFCESADINVDALEQGLEWLRTWQAHLPTCPTLALASRDDLIVPASMSAVVWAEHDLRWCDAGGHVLSRTKPDWCAQHIQGFLHDVS